MILNQTVHHSQKWFWNEHFKDEKLDRVTLSITWWKQYFFFPSLRGFSLRARINVSIFVQDCIKVWHLKPHGNSVTTTETSAVPVEGEHAACDCHVHWHLSRHAANDKHLLPCVGVEGRVVDVLGPPQLILRQARLHNPGSERNKTSCCRLHMG